MQGTIPADANLSHIKPAVRSGGLIDVNKTIVLDDKKTAKVEAPVKVVVQAPAVEPEVKVPEMEAPAVHAEAEAETEVKEAAGRRQRRTAKEQE